MCKNIPEFSPSIELFKPPKISLMSESLPESAYGEQLPAQAMPEKNWIYHLTQLMNVYKDSFKAFGKNQRRYETHARQYCQYLIETKQLIHQISFDNFVAKLGITGPRLSYTKKFLKFCLKQNIQQVVPDPTKRKAAAHQIILHYISEAGVSPGSEDTYIAVLNLFFEFLDDRGLMFSYVATRAYLEHCQYKDLAAHTRALYLTCIKNVAAYLQDHSHEYNINDDDYKDLGRIQRIKRAKLSTQRYYKDPLNEQERELLLSSEVSPSPTYRAMWSLMAFCGLRIKEVLSLKVNDLDFGNDVLWVLGKGLSTKEPCRFFKRAQACVHKYLKIKPLTINDLLFEMSYAKAEKEFRASLERMGLSKAVQQAQRRKVTLHSLRHTCAQLMYAHGNSIEIIQKQLRHRSIASTMVYSEKALMEQALMNIVE
ncbi:phage integrase family protein [Microscilla marina ATCC 23134]|uniref:Phage integrase family protein n=2 Tax=Microscilla marina TaxID=1027 RepID=A1ZUQ2_MICM2|nr:phage integrase family protein [Microscilla marina ATCC 23134]